MNLAEEFSTWARDPHRTNEELYLVELLIEEGHDEWSRLTKAPYVAIDYNALFAHRKRRLLNPAYRAKLSRTKLAHTVEAWAAIKRVSNDFLNDRPVRDLSALRFFPHLTKIELRTELADLSGLDAVQSLQEIQLRDATLADLGALARHTQLEKLSLSLDWPWPALASLAALPRLKDFSFHGNVLALEEVRELPAVEKAILGWTFNTSTPLRSLEQAPHLPAARDLQLGSTADLRGLERYNRLEKLNICGLFHDLSPIASLPHLRDLTLRGENFHDLAPLARLPRLRTLTLERERGLDLTPLSDSPGLRSVKSNCEVLKTELATLNAALGFIDVSEFLAAEPRPARPLRFMTWRRDDPDYKSVKPPARPDERKAFFGDDPLLGPAETDWFTQLVRQKLQPFGDEKWIQLLDMGDAMLVNLYRPHETLSLRQMVEALHPLLATTRFRWEILFHVVLNGDPDDGGGWEMPDRTVFDAEREREDWEEEQQYLKERREMLEREHQLNLQKQQGITVEDGASSAVDDEPDEADKPSEPATIEKSDDDDDDDRFVDKREFQLWIAGDIVWLHEDEAADALEFLGPVPLEDWHRLPEPPSERPYLHGW